MTKKYISILLLTLIHWPLLFAQTNNTIIEKGETLYQQGAYREAITLLSTHLSTLPEDTIALQIRGNCYWEIAAFDSAQIDYLTILQLAPNNADVHYNLSGLLELQSDLNGALYHMEQYVLLLPEDPNGHARKGMLLHLSGKTEEGLELLEKAVTMDGQNIMPLYLLAWVNYDQGHLEETIKWAQQAKTIAPLNSSMYIVEGLAYFDQKDYTKAADEFEQAFTLTDDISHLAMKAQALIMSRTPEEVFYYNNEQHILFKDIHAKNLKQLSQWSEHRRGKYSYKQLSKKFKNSPLSLSLDEYFMLYYGYANTKAYAPYSMQDNEMQAAFQKGDYQLCIKIGEELIDREPLNGIRKYETLALAYFAEKNTEKFEKYMQIYQGFLNGIMATGTGYNEDQALLVISAHDEYDIVRNLGYSSVTQELLHLKGHRYDLLFLEDEQGESRSLYFNIDKPFTHLSEQFMKKKK
ncbi:DUF4919 domain-containing protein [Algivirga pacifica]|uniref:Tetratricopeptide repeat-containing protein n=1 Tax=Algivirga pacifica TaxID=1162670 RepID=A0ABP9CY89_9BACT